MFDITAETQFSAAHRLLHYHGPCENLHGHNWLIRATVSCSQLDKCGIGIDFKTLKEKLNAIAQTFDHKDLNEVLNHIELNPSSENMARHIFNLLRESLTGWHGTVKRIEVFETPGNCAAYYE